MVENIKKNGYEIQEFGTIFNKICKFFQNTYIHAPSCIKIRTFWVLEDKYKVQQK